MGTLSAMRYADNLRPGRTLMDYVDASINRFPEELMFRKALDSEEAKSFQWDQRREMMSMCRWIGRIFGD